MIRVITKLLFCILLTLLAVVIIIFAGLNASPVVLHYYFGQQSLPLSLLLIGFFLLGAVCSLPFFVWGWLRLKTRLVRLRQRTRVAEQEVKNLRAIPLRDQH